MPAAIYKNRVAAPTHGFYNQPTRANLSIVLRGNLELEQPFETRLRNSHDPSAAYMLPKLEKHRRLVHRGRFGLLAGKMYSGCVVANMTEQTVTRVVCVDLQAQLVGTYLHSLNCTAQKRALELVSERGDAQRIYSGTLSAQFDTHGRVRR
jgi:hypothetical protein